MATRSAVPRLSLRALATAPASRRPRSSIPRVGSALLYAAVLLATTRTEGTGLPPFSDFPMPCAAGPLGAKHPAAHLVLGDPNPYAPFHPIGWLLAVDVQARPSEAVGRPDRNDAALPCPLGGASAGGGKLGVVEAMICSLVLDAEDELRRESEVMALRLPHAFASARGRAPSSRATACSVFRQLRSGEVSPCHAETSLGSGLTS